MGLTSIYYILFVCAVILFFYVLPKKTQWVVLLVSSIFFFFIVGTPYTFIYLLTSIIFTWYAGIKIDESKKEEKNVNKKVWFAIALSIDLGLLALLKYSNFVLSNTNGLVNLFLGTQYSWKLNLIASLGISFYTLQIVGYLLDCYWGIIEPQKNIFKLALFTCFFPQMVSGPISRYDQLKKELFCEHKFDTKNLKEGFLRITYGIYKKIVIAENLNIVVTRIMGETGTYIGAPLIAAMVAYVIQIYMDFSGCMDIVIGTAKCFGISMVENFNRPFSSKSIQEFWQRWHITLGLWLKDYIMYPLLRSKLWSKMSKNLKKYFGKEASKKIPTYTAMLILWFCMGLWHGGGWNYIFEGLWFWFVIVLGQLTQPFTKKLTKNIKSTNKLWNFFQSARTTFIYLIGAVFFYASSVKNGFTMLYNAFLPFNFIIGIKSGIEMLLSSEGTYKFVVSAASALVGFVIFLILNKTEKKRGTIYVRLREQPFMVCLLLITVTIYFSLIFGAWGSEYDSSAFIYGGF